MKNDPFKRYNTKQSYFLKGESEKTSLDRIDTRIHQSVKRSPNMPLLRWTSIAAAAILLFFVGKVFLFAPDSQGMADAYFEAYPNYSEPTLRGDNTFEGPYEYYDAQLFEEAVSAFESIQLSKVDSLYFGIAQCGNGDWSQAERTLTDLTSMPVQYEPARRWYLSLALIENGKQREAQELLAMLSQGRSSFADDAKDLLRAIK